MNILIFHVITLWFCYWTKYPLTAPNMLPHTALICLGETTALYQHYILMQEQGASMLLLPPNTVSPQHC